MQLPRTAAFAATALVGGGLAAYGTHRFWERTERKTFSNGWVAGSYAPAILGLGAVAASFVAPGGAAVRRALRYGGLGAMAGAVAGWGAYVGLTGRDAWAIPGDPEMRLAKDLRTRRAESMPGEGQRGRPQPVDPSATTFAVIGDYGADTREQEQVADNIRHADPDFILTVGDNVQTKGTDAEFRDKWDPPELFGDLRAGHDVYPTLGNHDIMGVAGPAAYFDRFPELAGRHWYSFERDGVSFFALDSNEDLGPGSEQRAWLERELAQAGEGWKVLYMHHPSIVKGDPDRLQPLLEQHDVDLVLVGHQHSYERSRPLNEHGTLHVATGSGGDTTREFDGDPSSSTAYRRASMGHVEVEVREDELVGRYRLRDGSIDDTWTITRRTDRGDA